MRTPRRTFPLARTAALLLAAVASTIAAAPVHAAPAARAEPPGSPGAWLLPLDGTPRILEHFDPPAERWLAGHRGADVEAAAGAAVRAPAAGRVVFSGVVVDRPVLTIEHPGGLLTSFEPATGLLPPGTPVSAGEEVAVVAEGGHCSGRCLHWGLRLHGEYIDPLNTVWDRRPSVLLPLAGPG